MLQGLQGLGFPVLLFGLFVNNLVVRIGRESRGRIRRVCEMAFGVSFLVSPFSNVCSLTPGDR